MCYSCIFPKLGFMDPSRSFDTMRNDPKDRHVLAAAVSSGTKLYGDTMTLDGLMGQAALECIDTRERHLAVYTVGVNGYVCKNEAAMDESRALFKGVYRDCQAWIERQGIAAALKYVIEHMNEVPELAVRDISATELLRLLSRPPE